MTQTTIVASGDGEQDLDAGGTYTFTDMYLTLDADFQNVVYGIVPRRIFQFGWFQLGFNGVGVLPNPSDFRYQSAVFIDTERGISYVGAGQYVSHIRWHIEAGGEVTLNVFN
jgi:hypothetical protein